MAIYWPTPGFKRRTFKLCVLTRRDLNFCVRSSLLWYCGSWSYAPLCSKLRARSKWKYRFACFAHCQEFRLISVVSVHLAQFNESPPTIKLHDYVITDFDLWSGDVQGLLFPAVGEACKAIFTVIIVGIILTTKSTRKMIYDRCRGVWLTGLKAPTN